jgi:uncharacterized protein (DUF302 family)
MMRFLLLLLALTVSTATPGRAQQGGMIAGGEGLATRPSRYGVADAMDRIEAVAKASGAKIENRINFAELSRRNSVKIRPNQLLVYDPGKGMAALLQQAPMAALDLPFKVLVWEDAQGKVWVTYTNASYLARRYAVGEGEAVNAVDGAVERIITEAMR